VVKIRNKHANFRVAARRIGRPPSQWRYGIVAVVWIAVAVVNYVYSQPAVNLGAVVAGCIVSMLSVATLNVWLLGILASLTLRLNDSIPILTGSNVIGSAALRALFAVSAIGGLIAAATSVVFLFARSKMLKEPIPRSQLSILKTEETARRLHGAITGGGLVSALCPRAHQGV
jgi:hypothetical protein